MSHAAALAIAPLGDASAPAFRFRPPASDPRDAADMIAGYAREAAAGLELFVRLNGWSGDQAAQVLEDALGALPEEFEEALGASRCVVIGDFTLSIGPDGGVRAATSCGGSSGWMIEETVAADHLLGENLQTVDTLSRLLCLHQSAASACAALRAVPGDAGVLWNWLRNRAAALEEADLVLLVSRCGVTAKLADPHGRPLGEWRSTDLSD